MKSISIKIPLEVAQHMDDRAQLNPIYLTEFITAKLNHADSLDKPISDLCYNYTFKIDNELHKTIKMKAMEVDLPMNDLVGRLIEKYYFLERDNSYG